MGIAEFVKNNFSRDEEINLRWTEKQPGDQEIIILFLLPQTLTYEKKVGNIAGAKRKRLRYFPLFTDQEEFSCLHEDSMKRKEGKEVTEQEEITDAIGSPEVLKEDRTESTVGWL